LVRNQVWSSAVWTAIVPDNFMNAGRLSWNKTVPPIYKSCFTHQLVYNYLIISFDDIMWIRNLVTRKIIQAINNHSIFLTTGAVTVDWIIVMNLSGTLRGIKEYSTEPGDSLRNVVFFLLLLTILCSQVPGCFGTYKFTQTFTTGFRSASCTLATWHCLWG
jgi:hypothetical protein